MKCWLDQNDFSTVGSNELVLDYDLETIVEEDVDSDDPDIVNDILADVLVDDELVGVLTNQTIIGPNQKLMKKMEIKWEIWIVQKQIWLNWQLNI